MAWTNSNWITKSGTDRKTALELHIQEISDQITANMSITGRSRGADPLNVYLKELNDKYSKLGGFAPRANGRSRVVRIDNLEPEGID